MKLHSLICIRMQSLAPSYISIFNYIHQVASVCSYIHQVASVCNYIHQIASTCNYIHQVSPVMGWGELGVAHPGALRPQKLPVELKILFQYKSKNAGPTLFVFMFVARRWQSPEQDPTLPKRLIDMDMFLIMLVMGPIC